MTCPERAAKGGTEERGMKLAALALLLALS